MSEDNGKKSLFDWIFKDEKNRYLVFGYIIFSNFLYIYAYWSQFDIDIISFASWEDALRLTLYPFIFCIAIMLTTNIPFIAIISKIESRINAKHKQYIQNIEQSLDTEDLSNKISNYRLRLKRKKITYIILLIFLLGFTLSLPYPVNYGLFIFFVTGYFASFFAEASTFKSHISNNVIRFLVITILFNFPLMMYSYGYIDATMIKNGYAFNYTLAKYIPALKDAGLDGETKLKYLGRTRDYLFFNSDEKSIIIRSDKLDVTLLSSTQKHIKIELNYSKPSIKFLTY